jgi:hypothetical protein
MQCVALLLLLLCLISTNALLVLTSRSNGLKVPSSLLCFGDDKAVGLLERSEVKAASDVSYDSCA